MVDFLSKRKRSELMSRVRSSGNKGTELRLIQVFRANGITGWRRGCSLSLTPSGFRSLAAVGRAKAAQVSGLKAARSSGRVKPDFVFPRLHVAVFVDGCFWHGCPRHATWPRTRAAFWRRKIEDNRARDRLVSRQLRRLGWRVLRIWEHELRRRNEAKLIRRLHSMLSA